LQPDESQDETPTTENLPHLNDDDVASAGDVSKSKAETVEGSTQVDVSKNHTLPRIIDHTSPVTSPSSTKSADDNGEQKLSTPGAASSGYGSAVLTQTTSSDDLLGDHTASDERIHSNSMLADHTGSDDHPRSDETNAERSNAGHLNSMVVTTEVNIIDAAVPSDLDSPLKPTTPYTDEPSSLPATSNNITITDSRRDVVTACSKQPEVVESSLERSAVSCGAISNRRSSVKTDSEDADEAGQSADQLLDLVVEASSSVDVNDSKNASDKSTAEDSDDARHVAESVTDLLSSVSCRMSSAEKTAAAADDDDADDAGSDDAGLANPLLKPQSTGSSSVTVRSTLGSQRTSYRPVSMPPEMTIIEDKKMDITTLGTVDQFVL